MTKQDMIRSLKKDLEDLKQFALVVVVLVTFFSALVGAYKGYQTISSVVAEAFEPTAEEVKAAEEKAARNKLLNELIADCERRCPVGMHARSRYAHCYDWALKQLEEE